MKDRKLHDLSLCCIVEHCVYLFMYKLIIFARYRYGSVSGYLNSIGFDIADQARLRLAMTSTGTDDKSSNL